ncbi:HTH-type transcriptional activator RhaR [Paenibacillus sp. JJ-100]|uniref:helix-turn-helix domain-containing protein n=1 Tax=Paenibacillus sp. JJ-100 TaxID=2974896 RepID=UPI0022FF9DA0|nr:helix-turn-helix domain-containing protein [Paenibacillus sp. JJ-100]CAI6028285.1 HTH-type transcriptional activator RhaR [Paenibacillus sp. JJ-100]
MRLLIVDDEVIIRTGLASVIAWHELGIELLHPAVSAEEALTRIAEERPHILMTDIRMNGKSGLELAEEALHLLPELEVIILSGYDDFSYAQQAIRNGVTDYLLKTSKPEEIIKTVLQAKTRITERWAEKSREGQWLRENRERQFIEWVIEGNTDAGRCPSSLAFGEENISPVQSCIRESSSTERPMSRQVVLIQAEGWSRSSDALLRFAVQNMLEDVLSGAIAQIEKQHIVCVLPLASELEASVYRLEDGISRIEQWLKCSLRAAVGEAVQHASELHRSYQTAMTAFRYRGLKDDKVWRYEEISSRQGGKTVLTHEEETTLGTLLLDNDPVSLTTWIRELIVKLIAEPDVTPGSYAACLHSVVIAGHRWLARTLQSIGREQPTRLEPWTPEPEKQATEIGDELFHHLYDLMHAYHSRMGQGQAAHVQKAIGYIETSLTQDISLQQVAGHVHLHPGHLSELFKKEMGVTFGDFVTDIRIRRAMDMLAVSPAKVSEIAAISGYEDVKYFSRLFKKHTGKTPSEYREQALGFKSSGSQGGARVQW